MARAKGLTENAVIWKHMLKNALIPIVTVVGLNFGTLLGGSVLTESIFSWPGVGRFVVDSISYKDTPAVLGSVVTLAILFTIVNLIVDLLYAFWIRGLNLNINHHGRGQRKNEHIKENREQFGTG
mgnify:CR=1 FL=1